MVLKDIPINHQVGGYRVYLLQLHKVMTSKLKEGVAVSLMYVYSNAILIGKNAIFTVLTTILQGIFFSKIKCFLTWIMTQRNLLNMYFHFISLLPKISEKTDQDEDP